MTKLQAIYKLNQSVVTLRGNVAYNAEGNEVPYDKVAAQAEMDVNAYKQLRALAYPTISDQLDMQYWDKINNTTTWADAIAKVKLDNPKGATV